LTDHVTITVHDSCGCPSAIAAVSGFGISQRAAGQGASFASNGLLHDHGGNDRYRITADARLRVTLDDRLSTPSAPPALDVIGLSRAWFFGQGAISGSPSPVGGVLIDDNGTDSYLASATDDTTASATSAHASGAPRVRAVVQPTGSFLAQGGDQSVPDSVGALVDAGGISDRFVADRSQTVTTLPDPDGAFEVGGNWPSFQGDGYGGVFLALGEDPSVVSRPSQTVCPPSSPGYRGFGAWVGCQATLGADPDQQPVGFDSPGAGSAPRAVGMKPSLDITADTPTTASLDYSTDLTADDPRLPVGARLVDPQGAPIVGAPVHFDLQWTASALLGPASWANFWEAEGVTGSDGVARARLPLFGTGAWVAAQQAQLPPASVGWRVLATYDGAPNLYPRHVAQAVTLAP
jgi:hypothetical protein